MNRIKFFTIQKNINDCLTFSTSYVLYLKCILNCFFTTKLLVSIFQSHTLFIYVIYFRYNLYANNTPRRARKWIMSLWLFCYPLFNNNDSQNSSNKKLTLQNVIRPLLLCIKWEFTLHMRIINTLFRVISLIKHTSCKENIRRIFVGCILYTMQRLHPSWVPN